MKNNKIPFRADHVGSFLRPENLKQARKDFFDGKITQEALRAVEDQEILRIVEKQKETGMKAITDGEFRRSWWHIDFLENLIGVEGYVSDKKINFNGIDIRPYNIRINGKLDFNPEHPFLEDFKFLKKAVGDNAVAKLTIPSPNMLLHEGIRNEDIYPNLDEYFADFVKTYQKAILAFYNVGCRYLQIDDTHWAFLAAENKRYLLEAKGVNVEELATSCAKVLNDILSVKPDDMSITMHVCRGNFASSWIYSGGYEIIAKHLFNLNFDGLFLEYDTERSGSFEPLKLATNPNMRIVLGLITSKTPELENPKEIEEKIKQATNYVPLDNLCLSPQCGFASTEEGNKLTEEEQWNKLKLVVEIANNVWND